MEQARLIDRRHQLHTSACLPSARAMNKLNVWLVLLENKLRDNLFTVFFARLLAVVTRWFAVHCEGQKSIPTNASKY